MASNFDYTLYDNGVDPFANTTSTVVNPNIEYATTDNVDEY